MLVSSFCREEKKPAIMPSELCKGRRDDFAQSLATCKPCPRREVISCHLERADPTCENHYQHTHKAHCSGCSLIRYFCGCIPRLLVPSFAVPAVLIPSPLIPNSRSLRWETRPRFDQPEHPTLLATLSGTGPQGPWSTPEDSC